MDIDIEISLMKNAYGCTYAQSPPTYIDIAFKKSM